MRMTNVFNSRAIIRDSSANAASKQHKIRPNVLPRLLIMRAKDLRGNVKKIIPRNIISRGECDIAGRLINIGGPTPAR